MNFTSKQKEIVARKLGYDGPMQGFDEYIASSPALQAKYSAVTQKYVERMAKGGMVQKFADGGLPTAAQQASDVQIDVPTTTPAPTTGGVTAGTPTTIGDNAVPTAPTAPTFTAAKIGGPTTDQLISTTDALAKDSATQAAANKVDNISESSSPDEIEASLYEASSAADKVRSAMEGTTIMPNTDDVMTATKIYLGKIQATPEQLRKYDWNGDGKVDLSDTLNLLKFQLGKEPSQPMAQGLEWGTTKGGVQAAQGTVSDQAQMEAAQGTVSDQSLATTSKVGEQYIAPVTAQERTTGANELVTAATADQAPTVGTAQTGAPTAIQAAQGVVQQNELAQAAQIKEEDMAQAEAITADGLAPDAVAVAARLEKFTVDAGTLAEAAQGNVDAQSTVQGQLTELMKSFDDGKTPAWAAGAIRAANAAMASRGLGGSSMAGAAIFQAAMESALPIATQDAQTFATMGLQNLNNRQQVALSNAAAQQGLSLQNLNNEQQAALQNSANAFALQSQNLSNMQQTMVANAQIRASLQSKNLDNQQQANLAQAARYAEMANMNLNNVQQARLQDSINAVNVDLANLSNRQQSYVVQAQLDAALQGKNLDNQQQAAVMNAARYAENANITFNAEQQAQIHNSTLMQTIGLAELSNQQAVTLANAATYAAMDRANLDARQQALVQNAQAFLQMDMANLNNEQQTTLFKAQQITQAILSDQAADNAAKQFNASSENQTKQFMASLSAQVSQFNAAQKNAVNQFNVDQENSIAKFNAEAQNARDQFNSQQRLVIDQSNAQWRRDISTADTAATNAANYLNAQNMQQLTLTEYNNEVQLYRDTFEMAWSSYEKQADRANQILVSEIEKQGGIAQAEASASGSLWEAALSFGTKVAGDWVSKTLFS